MSKTKEGIEVSVGQLWHHPRYGKCRVVEVEGPNYRISASKYPSQLFVPKDVVGSNSGWKLIKDAP